MCTRCHQRVAMRTVVLRDRSALEVCLDCMRALEALGARQVFGWLARRAAGTLPVRVDWGRA